MQAARHLSGNFHGHFVMTVFTANTQPHIVTTQPRIRRFVVNIQQLHGVMVLAAQRIEMVTQRLNGTVINNKL